LQGSKSAGDHRGVDLISDVLPFGRLCHGEPSAANNVKCGSRSHDAVIRVYGDAGNVIETHDQGGVQRVLGFAKQRG